MEHHVTAVVDAPAGTVWKLFTDMERWPELTPSMLEVRRTDAGPLRVGSEAVVRQPRLPLARWRVTELDPGRSFTWETRSPGITTAGGHQVTSDGQRTVITLSLRQRGPLAWLLGPLTARLARRYLGMELNGYARAASPAA
jgi:ligand-binding SRPBCC domain-containing protein